MSARPDRQPSAPALSAVAPVMLETAGWADYALLDSGHGRKLERYGRYSVIRPEPQALWTPALPETRWQRAEVEFVGPAGEEEAGGRWRFNHVEPPESWAMSYEGARFLGRFTAFRHVGLFPEQEAHWAWADALVARAAKQGRRPSVLNLFGYTGLASILAALAGAEVTHIDGSKKTIAWARENQALTGRPDLPIRWICDDATKFVERDLRRGKRYDGIILDPPKFGRGPKGEVWDIFEHLPAMLRNCEQLLSDRPLFLILTAYSIRASFMAIHELAREVLAPRGGLLESGELLLKEQSAGRRLSTSIFSRWAADGRP